MKGFRGILAAVAALCLLGSAPASRADDTGAASGADPAAVAATAVNVVGEVNVLEDQAWTAVAEGQLFGEGDRIKTGDNATLQLVLADGSSVALAPDSELTLDNLGSGQEGSVTLLTLARGLLNTMVEKLKSGSRFEVQTSGAVAAVKGTDFEVSLTGSESAVTVNEGTVQLGDAGRNHFEPVQPNERRRVVQNRVLAPETLSLEDRAAFHHRWARAHSLHLQRRALMRRFSRTPGRRRFLRQLRNRNAIRARRGGLGRRATMRQAARPGARRGAAGRRPQPRRRPVPKGKRRPDQDR